MIPLPSIISLPASQAGPFQLMGLFLLHGKSNKPPVLLSCPLPGVQLIPGIVVPVVASIPLSPHPPPPSPPSSLYSSRTVCQEGKPPSPRSCSHPRVQRSGKHFWPGAFQPQLILFNMFSLWSGADFTFPSSTRTNVCSDLYHTHTENTFSFLQEKYTSFGLLYHKGMEKQTPK